MKSLRLLVPVLAILGSGCLKLDETLTIREDGSANLDLVYAVSEQAVTQLKALLKVRDKMAVLSGDEPASRSDRSDLFLIPVEDKIRREIGKYEKQGVHIERLKVQARDNWRHVDLKLSCASLANLAKTDLFSQYGFSLSKGADGNYTFVRDRESGNDASSENLPDAETLKLLTPVIEGFKATFRINTPGKILKTNAHTKTARNATWEFNFDRNPNAITALQDQQFSVVFEGKGEDGKSFSLPEVTRKPPAVPKAQ